MASPGPETEAADLVQTWLQRYIIVVVFACLAVAYPEISHMLVSWQAFAIRRLGSTNSSLRAQGPPLLGLQSQLGSQYWTVGDLSLIHP